MSLPQPDIARRMILKLGKDAEIFDEWEFGYLLRQNSENPQILAILAECFPKLKLEGEKSSKTSGFFPPSASSPGDEKTQEDDFYPSKNG